MTPLIYYKFCSLSTFQFGQLISENGPDPLIGPEYGKSAYTPIYLTTGVTRKFGYSAPYIST